MQMLTGVLQRRFSHIAWTLSNSGRFTKSETSNCKFCSSGRKTDSSIPVLSLPLKNTTDNEQYRKIMGKVPKPVTIVTTALYDDVKQRWIKRGITCSSFNSTSLDPPVVSVSINNPSRMHSLLLHSGYFCVHILAEDQVGYAVHFAKPFVEEGCQFEEISHDKGIKGIPVLRKTVAVIQCKGHSVHTVGDHYVWYGNVLEATSCSNDVEPLLYYARTYRSVGDETFLQAFEKQTLPFVDWTHEAHLRMSWNYIKEHGREAATPLIRNGIKKYNERNEHLITRGYHETVTQFYIHMICDGISRMETKEFDEFIERNIQLIDKQLLFHYYSHELINSPEAKTVFKQPDKKPLP